MPFAESPAPFDASLPAEVPFAAWNGPEPGTGDASAVEVAPGVLWLRMPIELIPHINIWLLADGDGWTVVDCGTFNPDAVAAWEKAAAVLLDGKPVKRVIATHCHPDHCGMAGWIENRFGAELWMTRLEYQTALLSAAECEGKPPQNWVDFYRSAGWSDDALTYYIEEFGLFRRLTHPLPASYRRMTGGERLTVGGRTWEIVIGAGHSPEHASLYCTTLNLLISGDQILPKISSNVAVLPREPDANPLAEWLESLPRIADMLPADVMTLPAHGPIFHGLRSRAHTIVADHLKRLEAVRERLGDGDALTAAEFFPTLFRRPIVRENIRMATGEALAHLNYLWHRGEVHREKGSDGIVRWTSAGM